MAGARSPIGSVTFGQDDQITTATLFTDRTWTVERTWSIAPHRDTLPDTLALVYSDDYAGPQDGPYGPAILHRVAEWLGGSVTLADRPEPPADPDIVY